jgi:hypothetical protein
MQAYGMGENEREFRALSFRTIPPRELDPTISPQLQEITYRALERDPENRCARACEFANDLSNPWLPSVRRVAEFCCSHSTARRAAPLSCDAG